MARTEARIFTSIWKDRQFTVLGPGPQRLFMFLLSQDDLTYCGVMPLRVQRWVPKAAGLTAPDIERDLKELEAAPRVFVIADEDTGELFVRSLLRVDGIWKQPNLLKLARESAEQIESPRIRAALLSELRRLPLEETSSAQVKTLVAEFIQDLEEGTPYPTPYPPGNPSENPSDEGTADPPENPTGNHHAHARGYGEGNGSNQGTPRTPEPLFPGPPTSLPAQRDRRQGTRMPDPFPVTAEMVTWVREKCPHVDGKRETERFEDHWRGKPGKEGRKVDWVATWRNWMRTAEDRQGPRDRHRTGTSDQRGGARQPLATAEEAAQLRPEDIV